MSPADNLRWHVHSPPAGEGGGDWTGPVPEWLAALRGFRAEALYADGLRPGFRAPDGRYVDEDPADLHAYHVMATAAGLPVATLRVVPLAAVGRGFCDRLLGSGGVDAVLDQLDAKRGDAWEASGWAVHLSRRRTGVSAQVLAAGAAVARDLGLHMGLGASGSRYGQLYRVLAAGYRLVDRVEPIPVPALADDIQLVHGTLDMVRPGFLALVEQTDGLLEWEAD